MAVTKTTAASFANLWSESSNFAEFLEKTGHTAMAAKKKRNDLMKQGFSFKEFEDVPNPMIRQKNGSKPAPKIKKIRVKIQTIPSSTVDLDYAYCAGLFDACGHISGQDTASRFYLRIQLISTCEHPLEKVRKIFGGEIRRQESAVVDAGPVSYCLSWQLQEEAHRFVEVITPYSMRYKSKLELAVQWLEFQVTRKYEEDDLRNKLRETFGKG